MDTFRPRFVRLLGVLGWLVACGACAAYSQLTTERVDGIPAGQYQVVVSEHRGGGQRYDAVLFSLGRPAASLNLPAIERAGVASPDDYAAVLQAGFVVYAVHDASGAVVAYVVAPAQARVTAWRRPDGQGGALVTVTDLSVTPEAAGGAGGSM